MDFWEWVDKKTLQSIMSALIVGVGAATVRAVTKREKFKAFVIRLVSGTIMSGLLGYLIRDQGFPAIVTGILSFAAGWGAAEFGAKLNDLGKAAADKALGTNEEKETKEDESKPVD